MNLSRRYRVPKKVMLTAWLAYLLTSRKHRCFGKAVIYIVDFSIIENDHKEEKTLKDAEITYQFPNFNGRTVEVTGQGITSPCWDLS